MNINATYYANTGNIEDDIDFYFNCPFYLFEGMKIQYGGVLYKISDSFWDNDNGFIKCIFTKL